MSVSPSLYKNPLNGLAYRLDHEWFRLGSLFALISLAYSRALGIYFLGDDWTILNVEGIWSFAEEHTLFRPLPAWIMKSLFAWGGIESAWLCHLVSVLLHCFVAIMFYWVVKRLFASPWLSYTAALLFGLNFAHAEATYWLATMSSLTEGLCFLGAMFGFAKVSENGLPRLSRFGWTVFFLAMASGALSSRESSIVLPAVLLLYVMVLEKSNWTMRSALHTVKKHRLNFSLITLLWVIYFAFMLWRWREQLPMTSDYEGGYVFEPGFHIARNFIRFWLSCILFHPFEDTGFMLFLRESLNVFPSRWVDFLGLPMPRVYRETTRAIDLVLGTPALLVSAWWIIRSFRLKDRWAKITRFGFLWFLCSIPMFITWQWLLMVSGSPRGEMRYHYMPSLGAMIVLAAFFGFIWQNIPKLYSGISAQRMRSVLVLLVAVIALRSGISVYGWASTHLIASQTSQKIFAFYENRYGDDPEQYTYIFYNYPMSYQAAPILGTGLLHGLRVQFQNDNVNSFYERLWPWQPESAKQAMIEHFYHECWVYGAYDGRPIAVTCANLEGNVKVLFEGDVRDFDPAVFDTAECFCFDQILYCENGNSPTL